MNETDGTAGVVVIGEASLTIGKLASALAKAQGQIRAAIKDSENPFFQSRYSALSAVWDSCREPLSKNGIAIIQRTNATDGNIISLSTILAHESGEWICGTLNMKPVKSDPQGLGSCLTYARRYSLASMVGICSEEDDDGNKATGKPAESIKLQTPPQRKSETTPNPDGIKTAVGFIIDQKAPNKGGFVMYALEGYIRENGKPTMFSTKDQIIIDILDEHRARGERVAVEYTENENPAFANSIIGLVMVKEEVGE